MTYSLHQLAYFAHQLTRRAASNSMEALADIYESIEELKYYREHFLKL